MLLRGNGFLYTTLIFSKYIKIFLLRFKMIISTFWNIIQSICACHFVYEHLYIPVRYHKVLNAFQALSLYRGVFGLL